MTKLHNVFVEWNSNWNNSLAMVIEIFGLPGNRYHYFNKCNCMHFGFQSKKDADLCSILLSENILNKNNIEIFDKT